MVWVQMSLKNEMTHNTHVTVTVVATAAGYLETGFETNKRIYPKPRLTFLSEKSLLIVKMALPLHEIGITFLGSELSLMGGVPFDKCLITVIVDTNCECALSQDKDNLHEKFKFEVTSNPEVELVVKLKVDNGGGYQSPEPTSDTYKILVAPKFNMDSKTLVPSAESHLSLDDFTHLMDTSAPPSSVIVTGHTWCCINAVRYQIWVRGNTLIDIDVDDGPNVAHGTLFPQIDMDNVNNMIKRGLSRMRDQLAALFQVLVPQFDTSPIMQHNITFPVSLDWDHCCENFIVAAKETAHAWYIEWYHSELDRGVKHSLSDHDSDSNYIYSSTSQGDDSSNDDRPSSNTCMRKKQRTDGESVTI
ncbi:uncharacterized protein EDB91DRAFT_1078623 [Suillus paluster]|uniref:uncharacterized protein n=1 Tax=Suillus paluster TaxID=48578 RepID=UPI001B87E049|nr:uncharacterized protein EDB91DRAFT_1078623 [Suillus paluster]KAG1750613.1 hypothetical protein EDB91DRAFT_1078623 [Suillus paluster]